MGQRRMATGPCAVLPAWGSSPGCLYWEFRHTFSSQLLGVPLSVELSDCLPSTGILWCGSDVWRRACLYTCVNSLPPEQLRSKEKSLLLLMLLSSHLQNAESCCLSLKNIKRFSLSKSHQPLDTEGRYQSSFSSWMKYTRPETFRSTVLSSLRD